jgi:septal ring factor EnvC (AmiA/AmiB activator)
MHAAPPGAHASLSCCAPHASLPHTPLTQTHVGHQQVEGLRQLGEAAGGQLATTQTRLQQLQADKERTEGQLSTMQTQLQAVQAQLMQAEAQLAEQRGTAEHSNLAWQRERGAMQEVADKWRGKAMELQDEVSVCVCVCACVRVPTPGLCSS